VSYLYLYLYLAGGACCPLPKNITPLSALGLDFRPFGPHLVLSQRSSFPPMRFRKGLDKNAGIISAHFRSQTIHQNAGFCIKNIRKISGGRDPRTPAVEGEAFIRTHRQCSYVSKYWWVRNTRQILVPLRPPLLLGWLQPCIG